MTVAVDNPVETVRAQRWALAALALGAVAIAFSPIFVRLSELEPTATAFHRAFLAVPLLFGLSGARTGRALPVAGMTRRDVAAIALAGVFFAGDLAFWHWSIRYTAVANATLFSNVAPLFVALGAFVLFKERFSRTFLAGLALAMTGAAILMGNSASIDPDHLLGDAFGLITAVFYAAYILAIARVRARFSTLAVMSISSAATALALFPVAWASGEAMVPATAAGWAILIGLAWISHSGGQGLIAYALAHLPAAFSSVGLLLQPVVAALLAWALLAEPLGAVQALGIAVVLSGIYLARRGSR
jgi:drug/metabolite transporter (DMT)-like permease